ncbi:glutamate--cysteine ligase [Corynebacterium striatum]|uniref:glutamate--cysteine ligase n=1 Tax=Corynebacterium striatum TaxID=43770 RepID=UPI00141A3B74|nr:glutamate--cysteine ligase [Corynebacterium striatum]NHY10070.1 glutamate--cysteine ligase [Corynebacterium striatum]NHY34676.1 glutamate--cysteine ligase [Corynebacterium striatum]GKH17966.1 putative glutamate--cysteine ligase 2 [Corynebacterium striatum]HAT1131270.1 glutamate--cysteine ligase [Corynebacterium striatum]HAT1138989.1 glutamate--cysteine ligase [Corynebacterium striatum]
MNTPEESFARSAEPTLGVEWEVALVDPTTWDLVPRGAELIDRVRAAAPEIHLEKEFLQNTVELVTGICHTVPEAVADLAHKLSHVRAAADEMGVKLWASGGHPFTDFRENPVSAKESYSEIINRTQYWGKQMLLWGTHVHVGIRHEDRVWPIINALMTKYPHLLAISACSPAWEGLDTGYASNRTMLYQQLPTAGMPYQFQSWEEWQSYMRDQAISGVINHTGSMHFDIRPASKWGTVEVRISDASSNLRELSAVVALTHCLVVHYDRMIDRGEELPILQPWHVAENKWRGARYGMDALVITSRETDERWIKDELADLVEELTPLARELGCAEELALIHEIIDDGAGYERQRALYEETGSWQKVVEATCQEMLDRQPLERN